MILERMEYKGDPTGGTAAFQASLRRAYVTGTCASVALRSSSPGVRSPYGTKWIVPLATHGDMWVFTGICSRSSESAAERIKYKGTESMPCISSNIEFCFPEIILPFLNDFLISGFNDPHDISQRSIAKHYKK